MRNHSGVILQCLHGNLVRSSGILGGSAEAPVFSMVLELLGGFKLSIWRVYMEIYSANMELDGNETRQNVLID